MASSPKMMSPPDSVKPQDAAATGSSIREPSGRPSLKAEALKSLITTGIATLLIPLTVSITFVFTAALQSPNPSIEEANPTIYYGPLPLSRKARLALTRNPTTAAHLREAILARTKDDDPDCVSWLKDFQWYTNCAQNVRSALQEISDQAKAAMQDPTIGLLLSRNAPASELRELTQGIVNDVRAIATLEKEIDNAEDIQNTDRTGEFSIDVGVYNSGGSDGVIKSRAAFTFNGKKITLASNTWTPVKSHSFADATFSTWTSPLAEEQAVWEELKNKIKGHEKVDGTLEVYVSDKVKSVNVVLNEKD